jgi:DNA gyrase inhibitor GyrI
MPSASPFYATIASSDLINMTLQSDILNSGGQTETIGTPWDDDKIAYEDRYSFEVVGQVRSRIQPGVVFTNLSEIQVGSTLTNVEGAPDNSTGDDGNGIWQ